MLSYGLRRNLRLLAIGGLWGFLAGALAVAAIVWQATPSETWLGAGARLLAGRGAAHHEPRMIASPEDDRATLRPPVGTAGSKKPAEPIDPAPALGPPPAAELADRDLALPVEGVTPDRLVRSFDDTRGDRKHEAIDILAPMGTPVRAVENGRIARLFNSKAGGITVYQFDPTDRYCYYYAHLDRYAVGLKENDAVRRGQIIGYVGITGNAPKETPHLHFAIFRLTAEKQWWEGTPIDPYDVLR